MTKPSGVDLAKVKCEICGQAEHVLEPHLKEAHGMSVIDYRTKYPKAEVLSEIAKFKLEELEKLTRNTRVDFNIKKTFGVSINSKIKTVAGWEKPHKTTPEIDPDYHFTKEIVALLLVALNDPKEKVLLTGPTGSGKTSQIEQLAARLNLPFTRINCDSDLTRADFVGEKELEGDKTYFRYGLLPKAMIEGHVTVIDEWDVANPAVAMVLQAVLESNGRLVITETGEVITPHPDFRLFATSNTLGMGDDSGLYNGTQPQNYAQLDRFTMVQLVDYAEASVEKKIVAAKTGIDDPSVLDRLVEFGRLMRKAFMKEEIMSTVSTRTIVNVADKIKTFGDIKMAYELAFLNKLGGEDKKFGYEILQRVWGV